MTESDRERFGLPDYPVHEKLGPRTRHVLAHADRGETYIIRRRPSGDLSTAQILATGQPLTSEQIQLIREAANEPRAYYNGRPVFYRYPSQQDFAIQLHAASETLDLMLDLENPRWGFYCAGEIFEGWHWMDDLFDQIARDAFPEYACLRSGAREVWQEGVIAELERKFEEEKRDGA